MRRLILITLVILTGLTSFFAFRGWCSWGWSLGGVALLVLALYDVLQTRHAILKNFPVIGHIRYLLEMIRPEIQQYFIEDDTSGTPVSRVYRSVVYEKSKRELETVPFGSELDLYDEDYKWVNHSCFPVESPKSNFTVKIGGSQCSQPYEASLLNISAMSYGALSAAAIRALGQGAKAGGFYHNTGEGGLSPYHLESGADLVWQLGTAYFGARDDKGYFDPEKFAQKACLPQVKMIEIKISQGAKPGHGGILPGVKVNDEIARIRQVPVGKTVISPPGHTAFTNPTELCGFIQRLRELSGGKPVGFKLCLGRRDEFIQICEAMKETGLKPDFVTVDGGEGGTGAAPFDFINYVGGPLKESLFFVHTTLKDFGLRDEIKVIASGKVFSAFNLFEKLALGADLCNSARGMMLALGCIQAYRCNTNTCPTGIATNKASLEAGLNVKDKGQRVFNYHQKTLQATADLLAAVGLRSPKEVALKHISCRYQGRILTLAELFEQTPQLSRHERADRRKRSQGEPSSPLPVSN
jgi:glutamate synthase domain-containing protein 2